MKSGYFPYTLSYTIFISAMLMGFVLVNLYIFDGSCDSGLGMMKS